MKRESTQIWQWVKREAGKPTVRRELRYHGGSGDNLLQRLQGIAFSIDEEDDVTVATASGRVRKAFDVERVTKRFYERFRTELGAFTEFIEGITNMGDRDWYASLMLNRMMFVYFIQKQGFLADDQDYLRNKLSEVRGTYGDGQFQGFYREFLLRLFHEGLGKPATERPPDLVELLGEVPFLNGGLFDPHELERDYPDIAISDETFERVFEFFDDYSWHLDERPNREDNEINPDVLGYIFEKYVNQKQMGAYYTKEDITGYISRNTVIPFLFDAARKKDNVAFQPGGGVWRLLQDDPDRYIYRAVGHGITWNARAVANPERLDEQFDLPPEIAAGIADVSKRGNWNEAAPEAHALPTETWREVVARRQRYEEVRAKLESGDVTEINDLITLNLDIEQFARDVIAQSEGRTCCGRSGRPCAMSPCLILRAVPARSSSQRSQHPGAALHRLPGGNARLRGRRRTCLSGHGPRLPQRFPRCAGASQAITPMSATTSSSPSSSTTSTAWTSWRRPSRSVSCASSSSWSRSWRVSMTSSRCRTSTSTSVRATHWSGSPRLEAVERGHDRDAERSASGPCQRRTTKTLDPH